MTSEGQAEKSVKVVGSVIEGGAALTAGCASPASLSAPYPCFPSLEFLLPLLPLFLAPSLQFCQSGPSLPHFTRPRNRLRRSLSFPCVAGWLPTHMLWDRFTD
ncbi:uncharacterized protein [Physcomitrium patens]|uniref:uncharacterized protein n=1 Tax=Physcomitrium patens TaxID=3218 RepID=UPI003CCCD5FD